ncbi:MAG: THxN family PEP-CTERM protein [Porticoccaceae bacterium]
MKASQFIKQVAIGVGLGAALMGSANAGTLITSFDYTQEFEWVEPIAPAGINKEGATAGASDVDGYTKLSWGTESNSFDEISSLVINPEPLDPTTPSNVLTAGTVLTSTSVNAVSFSLGPIVTHNNFVITGTSLDSTTAQDYVVLSPFGGGADQVQQITFGIDFQETNNNPANPGACPAGVAFNGFGCGDIFALSGGLLGVPTILNGSIVAFLIDSFLLDGFNYDVYITAPGLGVLTDAACAAVGAGPGCIGFTTFENESNSFQLAFAIIASESIPEPATLALFAGSLLLMGLVRRRKTQGGMTA